MQHASCDKKNFEKVVENRLRKSVLCANILSNVNLGANDMTQSIVKLKKTIFAAQGVAGVAFSFDECRISPIDTIIAQ